MAFGEYNPSQIEPKWQAAWEAAGVFRAQDDFSKKKFYALIEFPYPSGAGLHVGHPRSNTALDILSRKRRMEGYNVLYPIGWDAFGLPTENYAIQNRIHPAKVTQDNIRRFTQQLKALGFSFDWSREVDTTDPNYYRWTQWIFLQFFKKGLAYKAQIPINFCTSCRVGLANEEVVDNACERCGAPVERRLKNQWMLRITEYAQKLLDGLDTVDFIERVKAQQRNWIGRSEGMEVLFRIDGGERTLTVFTTRPDTLFGATYMVLSPEHPYIDELSARIRNIDKVIEYRAASAAKSEFERTELSKDKTGVPLEGVFAVNPVNGEKIPIWVSDYVLMSYGTGAIMAVPGHDQRDWDFAKRFNLPIVPVVEGGDIEREAFEDIDQGVMINSDFLDGMAIRQAQRTIADWLEARGLGKVAVNYKLRDWVFSRQRYWGEPIPLVYCADCGWVPVPDDQLPVRLPELEAFMPTDDGESPLKNADDWVNTSCPCCGGPAQRETDTMPNWAGSSWYFLRYIDPHNDQALADPEKLRYWLPVDWYNGGMEHTTLHLLYSRFWHRFLYDIGVVPTMEAYQKRTSHGMILGENGEKMSKSRGNVVNPDDLLGRYGADAFRTYEMFMGAFDQPIPWSTDGLRGCRRFLDRVWRMMDFVREEAVEALEFPLHRTIKKVGEDFERMKFNTAIAGMMEFTNACYDKGAVGRDQLLALLRLLSPVAPHICEEMNALLGGGGMLAQAAWPQYDPAKLEQDEIQVAVQVNGRVRAVLTLSRDASQDEILQAALADEVVQRNLQDKNIVKQIYVPGRTFNIVAK